MYALAHLNIPGLQVCGIFNSIVSMESDQQMPLIVGFSKKL